MKLVFLTLEPFSLNAGHLARLASVLDELSTLHRVTVICLGKNPDDQYTKARFKEVSFLHFPIPFKGWHIENMSNIVANLTDVIKDESPDLVVLQMEAWELMRELSRALKDIVPFTVVIHAMPFLVSPLNPSGNFAVDISKYLSSGIEEFRRTYVEAHYTEADQVFRLIPIIAANKTVAYYLSTYFKNLSLYELTPNVQVQKNKTVVIGENPKYDFVYMARMEAGKGVEYLVEILNRISSIVSRPVSVAILGRTDDVASKDALAELLSTQKNNYRVDYFGWVDERGKEDVLPKSGVFLYPSHYDNYPSVVNEALAFGLPVVAWDVPFMSLNYASVSAVKRVPLFDFQRFAEAAVEALAHKDTLAERALEFIHSQDSPTTVAKLDTKIYEDIARMNA